MNDDRENVQSRYLSIYNVPETRRLALAPQVARFGHCTALAGTRNNFEERSELEFCFRLSGAEEFAEDVMDGVVYRNRFPHLFIKLPGVSYRFRANATRSAVFVVYSSDELARFGAAGITGGSPCFEFELTPEIQQCIKELRAYEKHVHAPGAAERIDLAAMKLIASVVLQNRCSQDISGRARVIMDIASYIECHLTEEIDFRSIAEKRGLSLRSFFRSWREQFKETPAQYLISRRLGLAKQLLTMSDMMIDDVARQSGFSSTAYFIHVFKKHCGVTPGVFRRKYRS